MGNKFVKQDMSGPRERILMAAWDLFHAKGIEGTSVDDILRASETGKSQFYHYFGSKDGIVKAALETARDLIANNMIEGCGEINSWDDLEESLNSYTEKIEYYNYTRVCPIGRFAVELGADDESVRKEIELIYETKKRFIRDFLIKAQARDELCDNVDIDAVTEFYHASVLGACILAKTYKSSEPVQRVNERLLDYIRSLKK